MEFDIDFGTMEQRPPERDQGPLIASVDGRVAQLSPEECVFQIRGSDQVHVMTMDVLRAMDLMRQFRPKGEQISHIEARIPELKGRQDAISRVTDGLATRGLLTSAEDFLDAVLDHRPRSAAPVPIVIRSCERPESLSRLLESLEACGTQSPVYVLDDSRQAEVIAANRTRIGESSLDAVHLDRAWRGRLAEHLNAEVEDADALQQLLAAAPDEVFGGGAAWNAGVLLTAGQRPVFLDDDVRWDLREPAEIRRSASVAPSRNVPMRFAADDTELLQGLVPGDTDWLGLQSEICGQPLGCALEALDSEVDAATLAGQAERDLRHLLHDAVVKTTRLGYYGAPEMETRLWFCLSQGESARSLWQDRERYFKILSQPRLVHGFDRPWVAELSHFTPTAMDNTELLPPTAPSGRGEDLGFATFLRYLHPRSVTLHLPAMLAHERPEPRPPENPDAYQPWSSRFFGEFALAHMNECEAALPEERAAQLAMRFRDIAAASETRRIEMLREFLGYMRAQIVSQLQQALLASAGAPEYWRQELTDWIEANGRALTEIRPPRLRGWADDLDAAGCAAALAEDAENYARWLECWPTAWRACYGRADELIRL